VRECWGLPPSLAAVLPWNVPLPPVLPSRVGRGAPRALTVTRHPSLPTSRAGTSRPIRFLNRPRVRPTHSRKLRANSIGRVENVQLSLKQTFWSILTCYWPLLDMSSNHFIGKYVSFQSKSALVPYPDIKLTALSKWRI